MSVSLLNTKHRHNGSVLTDAAGHIIHIGCRHIFTIAPAGIEFTCAPFPIRQEMLDVMGGRESAGLHTFVSLACCCFLALRHHLASLLLPIDLMVPSQLECLKTHSVADAVLPACLLLLLKAKLLYSWFVFPCVHIISSPPLLTRNRKLRNQRMHYP